MGRKKEGKREGGREETREYSVCYPLDAVSSVRETSWTCLFWERRGFLLQGRALQASGEGRTMHTFSILHVGGIPERERGGMAVFTLVSCFPPTNPCAATFHFAAAWRPLLLLGAVKHAFREPFPTQICIGPRQTKSEARSV